MQINAIFRKIYLVILNFSSKICNFSTEKSYLDRGSDTLWSVGRLLSVGGRAKIDCVCLATFFWGGGRATAYDLESVGGRVVIR